MPVLKDILYKVALKAVSGDTNIAIESIQFDSRKIAPGAVFIALKGEKSDGHDFIDKAISLGAVAILVEELPVSRSENITWLQVEDSHLALGILADHFYGHASSKIKLIGITGTNGKTTCATLLYKLFTALGYSCGLISTIENIIGTQVLTTNYTTPDAIALNFLLSQMVDAGCEYCFMEVSSHAIVQRRIAGLQFAGGVFTNITHDHLDFHKTFDGYIKAKKAFFDALDRHAFALVNADDRNGMVMLQNTAAHKKTYAMSTMADFKGRLIENQFSGMLMNVDELEVWFRLVGSFNASNILAVYGTAMLLEQDKLGVLTILSRLTGAEGRFEYVMGPGKIIGIVDYAHTPDALINVLNTIRDIRKGSEKIITIIGCGGDRDKSKRPEMARAAFELSDKVIFTADNPRTEDPEVILEEMKAGLGLTQLRKVLIIADRRAAIRTACQLATDGDIILLAGKGHEKYQEIEGVRYPFDDRDELTNEFKNLDI